MKEKNIIISKNTRQSQRDSKVKKGGLINRNEGSHLPPKHAPNAPKAPAELRPLLGPVGHELDHAAPLFVVFRQVVGQAFLFDGFQLAPFGSSEPLVVLLLLGRQEQHRFLLG